MDNQQGNSLQVMDEHFEPLAYSIGAMTGDGSIGKYGPAINVHLRSMDSDCVQRVKYEIDSFFGTDYKFYSYTNSNGTLMYGYNASNALIYDFFKYFIEEKLVIRDEVFRASRKARLDFLAGLFDTDGYVAEQKHPGAKYGYSWRVGFASRHKPFVEDVARLLQKLGVKVGKIHEQTSGFSRTIYVIKPNIRSFVDAGCYFQIPRKAKRLRHYVEAVKPSETIMPHPQRRGEDIVQQ